MTIQSLAVLQNRKKNVTSDILNTLTHQIHEQLCDFFIQQISERDTEILILQGKIISRDKTIAELTSKAQTPPPPPPDRYLTLNEAGPSITPESVAKSLDAFADKLAEGFTQPRRATVEGLRAAANVFKSALRRPTENADESSVSRSSPSVATPVIRIVRTEDHKPVGESTKRVVKWVLLVNDTEVRHRSTAFEWDYSGPVRFDDDPSLADLRDKLKKALNIR